MGDGDRRSHMASTQKIIAYSAIAVGVVAFGMAIGSSVHITYYVLKTNILQIM